MPIPSSKAAPSAGTFPAFCGATVFVLGCSTLLAWALGWDANDLVFRLALQTKANTALCLAALGLALYLRARGASARGRVLDTALVLLPACLASVGIAEHAASWDSGLGRLISADARSVFEPGRMAPLTTVAILMACLAMVTSYDARVKQVIRSQWLSAACVVLAALTLLAHLYGAAALLHLLGHTPMALNTAVLMLVLGVGILLQYPDAGLVAPLSGKTSSAQMGRRLLAMVWILLPFLAWLRVLGQQLHLYSPGFGIAIVVMACLAIMSVLIVLHTSHASHAETRLLYLNRVYSVLSEVNSLIVRATSPKELFSEAHRIAVERGAFPRAWLGVLSEDGSSIVLVAGHADADLASASLQARLSLRSDTARPSPIARAVHSGQAVVSNDVANDRGDPFRDELLAHGIRSFAVFPLVLAGKVIGIFKLHAEVPNFFHEDELKLLHELAGDITFAIHHLEQQSKLDHLAYFDSLTGLANPRLFEERLGQAINSTGHQGGVAVVVADLIAFKAINEAFGRQVGDETLKEVARRLGAMAGVTGSGRLGANLFGILLHGHDTESALIAELDKISAACFSQRFDIAGNTFTLAARAGIAVLGRDGRDARTLINNAEAALASARMATQRYRFHHPGSNARNAERVALQSALTHALAHDELRLHYQVKIDCKTLQPCGAEALLRWTSATLGAVGPSRFVPLLEDIGMIDQVGRWALIQAATDSHRHIAAAFPGFRIAVNVSASQLLQDDFVDVVEAALGEFLPLVDIDLELTESLIMADVEAAIAKLRRLRALGLKIAIDDFGTGYSSMAYLARLPLDYLKIDQAFVTGLPQDKEKMTVIASMIGLGHALGLQVIVEGVETDDQADMLIALGCDQLQGFNFGKAEPLQQLVARLETARAGAGSSAHAGAGMQG